MLQPSDQDVKRVAIVGPECTGKSTLAQDLSKHYDTTWVPEYARGYIDTLTRPYEQADLTSIARGQLNLEQTWTPDAKNVLICDTNLLVIKIWSEFRFGSVDKEITKLYEETNYDHILLTYVDVPWEEDPQREHPFERERLYEIYLHEVRSATTPFTEIRGDREQRLAAAIAAIDRIMQA